MIFVKRNQISPYRLLYVMGSTWHTKCMFDLDCDQPSFCDLLVEQGIETYAMDNIGAGPGTKPIVIGDQYQQTLNQLQQIVNNHRITHVMSYLNGSSLAADLAKNNKFNGLIFLDPVGQISLKRQLVDNDHYVINKKDIAQALIDNNTNIDPDVQKAYLDAVGRETKLITAAWPILNTGNRRFYDQAWVNQVCSWQPVKTYFTRQSNATVRSLFTADAEHWNNSSWILLEPQRVELAKSVADFVKCH